MFAVELIKSSSEATGILPFVIIYSRSALFRRNWLPGELADLIIIAATSVHACGSVHDFVV